MACLVKYEGVDGNVIIERKILPLQRMELTIKLVVSHWCSLKMDLLGDAACEVSNNLYGIKEIFHILGITGITEKVFPSNEK